MKVWQADFVNDPLDDYNLMVEITYNYTDVASIKKN